MTGAASLLTMKWRSIFRIPLAYTYSRNREVTDRFVLAHSKSSSFHLVLKNELALLNLAKSFKCASIQRLLSSKQYSVDMIYLNWMNHMKWYSHRFHHLLSSTDHMKQKTLVSDLFNDSFEPPLWAHQCDGSNDFSMEHTQSPVLQNQHRPTFKWLLEYLMYAPVA